MSTTVYDLKAKLATVGEELAAVNNEMVSKLANPSVPIEEINALETKKNDIQKRFDLLKSAHDEAVAAQEARIRRDNPVGAAASDKERLIAAKAELIRATVLGRSMSEEARNLLHALPPGSTNTSGGANFLPTTMANELVHEPFSGNPLREVLRITSIKGLEVPKIGYTIDDNSFINDTDTAKEMALTGDKVSFGRFKTKVIAKISDTVLHGSDLQLVSWVENALRDGLAVKENTVSFTDTPGVGEGHMSFYEKADDKYVIKTVEGESMFEAITAAFADLHQGFRRNAKVVMRVVDYYKMLRDLANGSATLFQAQPEQIIGYPVVFDDSATVPIVGDFRFAHLNYDPEVVYDSDKDVKSGEYLFVLTAWFDQRRLLNSAFRLAEVEEPDEVPEE